MSNKKTKKYNPISAGLSYTIGNMLIKGIPFLTLPIFTRILSTADFGLYNTYLSYESVVSIVLGLGLNGTIRVAKVQYKERFEEYVSAVYGIQILMTLLFWPIIYLLYSVIGFQDWFDKRVLVILLLHCLCTALYNIASAKFAINGNVKMTLMIAFMMTFFNVGLSLIFCNYFFDNEKYLGRILGTFLAAVVVITIAVIEQARKSIKWFNWGYWKFGLKMGLPLIPHMLSLTLLGQCDKIMIQAMVGDSEAGIYSLAVNISSIVAVLVSSVDNAWAPWFFRNLEEKKHETVRENNNHMIKAFSLMTAIILLVSPEIIWIMADREYWDSIYVLMPLIISVLFNFYYLLPVNFEYFHKKTWYISFSTVVTSALNIALVYFLIHRVGYIGAAYATCFSKIVLFLMHWRMIKKIDNVKLADTSKIAVFSILVIIIAALSLIFRNVWIVRYLLVIVVLILMYKQMLKIEMVNNLLKKVKERK